MPRRTPGRDAVRPAWQRRPRIVPRRNGGAAWRRRAWAFHPTPPAIFQTEQKKGARAMAASANGARFLRLHLFLKAVSPDHRGANLTAAATLPSRPPLPVLRSIRRAVAPAL